MTDSTVNDAMMDTIRAKYEVLDRIIKTPAYDGKAVKEEAWEAFKEIRRLRLELIEARNPGIDLDEVQRR